MFPLQILILLLSTIGLVFTHPGHGTGGQKAGLHHHDDHGKMDAAKHTAYAPSNIVKRSPAPQLGILDLRLNETLLGNFGFQFRPNNIPNIPGIPFFG